jgi:hypothetical protein
MCAEDLNVFQGIADPAIGVGMAREIDQTQFDLGSRQGRPILPNHLGGFTGTEQTLQLLLLVRLNSQLMHLLQEILATGEDVT